MPAAIAGALFAAGTFGYAATYLVVTLAINYGLSKLAQSQAGKKHEPKVGPVRDVTVRGTMEPMQMIYGETRASGVVVYYCLSGSAIHQDYLHFIVAYAGHQCEDVTDVWLDSRRVADSDINASTGEVTATAFRELTQPRLWVERYLGTKNQTAITTADSEKAMPNWTVNHRGAGVCYVHYILKKSEQVWPNGAPSNFFALVKGARVYDPRKDSSNGGSGSHRYADATTWEWSNNEPLCRRDYITGGSRWFDEATPEPRLKFGDDNERVNDEITIASANIADEDVDVPDGEGGSTTQKRYTLDIQLSCGDSHRENLLKMESASVGETSYVNGQYRIHVGAYDTPEVDIVEDDIIGPIVVATHPNGEDLYNFVDPEFFDEDRDWQLLPAVAARNSSYEADDGDQYKRHIQLHGTRTNYRCQRIAMLHLAKSRHKTTIRFERLPPKAMQIAQHDTFTVTCSEYGWSSKVFRCEEWEWLNDGWIALTAREESSSSYTDPEVEDYGEPEEGVVDTPQLDLADTPLSLSAIPLREGIYFRWTMPQPEDPRTVFRLYRHTSSTPFSSAVEVGYANSKSLMLEAPGQSVAYYWIVSELNGRQSDEYPVGAGLAAAPYVQGFDEQFHDSFEHQDYERFYNLRSPNSPQATVTYPTNGENGGRVLRAHRYFWIASNRNIPYDPNATYLMTVRARLVTAPTNGQDFIYAGIEGVAADGVTLINKSGADSFDSQHYFCAANADMGAASPIGTWQTFRGYLSGLGATPTPEPRPNITNPMPARTGVRFIRPVVVLNYEDGDGIMEIDYIKLEKVVQTALIGENAATELAFLQAGNFSGASPSTTLHDLSNPTTYEFTPTEDCRVIVTGTFIGSKTGGVVAVFAYLNNITDGVIETTAAYQLSGTPTFIMVQEQFNLTAGKAYRVGVRADSDSTGNTETYAQPITTQLEIIKR